MKTFITATASLAIAATISIAAFTPANADTLRRVECSNGKIVMASGTQSNAQACRSLAIKATKASRRVVPDAQGMKTIRFNSARTHAAPDNTAHAWTAGCYAEFGPNAKWPDAALLEKCLD